MSAAVHQGSGPVRLDAHGAGIALTDSELGAELQAMAQEWTADRLAMANAIARAADLEQRLARVGAALRGEWP